MSAGLFDIAPPTEIVSINGADHKVRGLPLRIIVDLLKDYPAMIGMLMGKGITEQGILAQGPQAASIVIAAGYGLQDDAKAREAAANLPLDVQLDLIAGIVKATLGGGAGPFAEKVKKIYAAFETMKPPETTNLTDERERKLERIRQRLSRMQSQSTSNSSSPEVGTVLPKFGT